MSARLKLKRGLSDISPLFSKDVTEYLPQACLVEPEKKISPNTFSITRINPEICYIGSVDDESDAHFLNNYFASKMAKPHSPALLVTFEENEVDSSKAKGPEVWSQGLRRLCLPASRIQDDLCKVKLDSHQTLEILGSPIFLEASMSTLVCHPALVSALDHVVLFLKPQVDSVTEAYRQLKRLFALEIKAEVTILFDANDSAGVSSRLFELFSDFVSRRLSLSMNYLGTLHLSRGAEGLHQDIRWDRWSSSLMARSGSIEKMRFLSWVDKLIKEKSFQ